jgi:hypothetical protein
MPPTRALKIERIVKRVDNAIHNPSVNYRGVKDALADLKAANIRPSYDDYDHWIRLAIDARSERKLCYLFGSVNKSALLHLLEKGQLYLPMYMKSSMFNPNKHLNDHYYNYDFDILSIVDDSKLTLFFRQPKAWPILNRLGESKRFRKYYAVNPIAIKRKQQRTMLLRFWLLTTKSLLNRWRESLYFPGTGALYKKAAAAFEASIHRDKSEDC